ncbi:MAG: 2-oxoacid:acceptor oxidoreductase subunit alpha [Patescibacteria group bacterium]
MKKTEVLTWKIGGIAGGGQQVAGLIFAKACARGGLYTFDSSEYPSLIRGGLVTYRLSISSQPLSAIYRSTNLLIALTQEALDHCVPDVISGGAIIVNSDTCNVKTSGLKGRTVWPISVKELTAQANVPALANNMIMIGMTTALFRYDIMLIRETIKEIFQGKDEKVIADNIRAAEFGYEYARKNFKAEVFPYHLPSSRRAGAKVLVTANDTVSLGAVASGCKFFVAYPMTPATSILHNLMGWSERSGMMVIQPEDEIAAIHMAIGASYTGVRAMTATSGGGFALMNEGLALAAMTETPLVIVEGQRPGPATGLPTWTEQGDLAYLARAGHGEFPRVILAPGDAAEAYPLTGLAFNLADRFQIPVFILLDKYLSEAHQSHQPFTDHFHIDRGDLLTDQQLLKLKEYKRYLITKTGISSRTIPGQMDGLHLANSDEHDEAGYTIEGFSPELRTKMVAKRLQKLPYLLPELPKPKLYGPKNAQLTLLGWGSTKGPVLEALKELTDVNYFHVTAPWPLSQPIMTKALSGCKKIIAVENNATGQFAQLLKGQTGIAVDDYWLKHDGAQFYPEEILAKATATGASKK